MTARPRPLIGITCSTKKGGSWCENGQGNRIDYVYQDYAASVVAAGGLALAIPYLTEPELLAGLLDRLDGLIFTGGPDILPRCYGEEPLPGLREVDHPRDVMELNLARQALAADLPILGICRGIQILTVAKGGGLYQDVARQVPGALLHRQPADKKVLSHKVHLTPSSKLAEIIGAESIWVNSGHHQAVKDPPAGFAVSARASDGVIEAIERPGNGFCIGVQWHPEATACHDPASKRLFEAFLDSSRQRLIPA